MGEPGADYSRSIQRSKKKNTHRQEGGVGENKRKGSLSHSGVLLCQGCRRRVMTNRSVPAIMKMRPLMTTKKKDPFSFLLAECFCLFLSPHPATAFSGLSLHIIKGRIFSINQIIFGHLSDLPKNFPFFFFFQKFPDDYRLTFAKYQNFFFQKLTLSTVKNKKIIST